MCWIFKILIDFLAVDFICNFELSWYPFDSQSCFLNFSLDSAIFVELTAGSILYLGREDLAQYFVRNTSITETGQGTVAVRVGLGRRILSPLLTVYVPTLMLNIIALATNYFKVISQFLSFVMRVFLSRISSSRLWSL